MDPNSVSKGTALFLFGRIIVAMLGLSSAYFLHLGLGWQPVVEPQSQLEKDRSPSERATLTFTIGFLVMSQNLLLGRIEFLNRFSSTAALTLTVCVC